MKGRIPLPARTRWRFPATAGYWFRRSFWKRPFRRGLLGYARGIYQAGVSCRKMNLTKADAIAEIIYAKTDLAAKLAARAMEGRVGEKISALRKDFWIFRPRSGPRGFSRGRNRGNRENGFGGKASGGRTRAFPSGRFLRGGAYHPGGGKTVIVENPTRENRR